MHEQNLFCFLMLFFLTLGKGYAGMIISYWGSKFMALRRCQKPSALGDEVTVAIDLLVRLLPLIQMILMYRLYFQVCFSDQHTIAKHIL